MSFQPDQLALQSSHVRMIQGCRKPKNTLQNTDTKGGQDADLHLDAEQQTKVIYGTRYESCETPFAIPNDGETR